MNNKLIDIFETFHDLGLDVLALTETWLEDGDIVTPGIMKELGFNLYSSARGKRGGGVAILAKKSIRIRTVKLETKPQTFECIQATVEGGNLQKTRLVVVYRPPSTSKKDFLIEFEEFISTLNGLSGHPLILGDFNIHTEDENDPTSKALNELLLDERWIQHVEDPTHVAGGTLDLVISRDDEASPPISAMEVARSAVSDHYAVTFHLHVGRPDTEQRKVVMSRKMKNATLEVLSSKIADSSLVCPLRPNDLEDSLQLYYDTLSNIIDEVAPVEKKIVKDSEDPPWYTKDCVNAKRNRRKHERAFKTALKKAEKKSDYSDAWIALKHFTDETSRFISKTRVSYYREQLNLVADDPAAVSSIINKLLGKDKIPQELPSGWSDDEAADKFSAYFKSKIENIYEMIKVEKALNRCVPDLSEETTFKGNSFSSFKKVSDEELTAIITSMSKKHCDLDPIPTRTLVGLLPQLLPIISDIVNGSLQEGRFPEMLKQSLVRPSFKKKDSPEDMKNYRPVSNLSFISKVIEKCAAAQLTEYLEENKLFPGVQSAYRTHHSTETTLVKVVNDLLLITDEKSKAILVLLDLSAAFDTINHKILLGKLKRNYGVTGTALSWFESYLTDRKASVKVGNSTSLPLAITIGVPQGSILGPLLFVLYTKELESIAKHYGLLVELYADDTQLYVSFTNSKLVDLEKNLQECLNHIKVWMADNFLRLNPSKTEFLVLRNKHDKEANPEAINALDSKEPSVPAPLVRNLGVFLDSELSLTGNVSKTVRACNLCLLNLWKIGNTLTIDLKVKLVNTLIHSRLDYCNSLLAGASAKDLGRLQKVQNAATRFITGRRSLHSTSDIRKQLHFLPVKERISYKLCLLTYKALNGLAPTYLSELVQRRKHKLKNLRRDTDITYLERKFTHYCSSKGAFSIAAPAVWNDLPKLLRENTSVLSFKANLKTHFFKKAYKC